MNKAEAIKILNNYDLNFCDIDGNPIPPQDLAEACDMAIEALEQEPTTHPFTEEQIQTMQELESAQVEKAYELGKADRATGRWHIEPGIGCFCSKCSFDIGNDLDFMEYVHYCPNCGCAMKGGEEE